MIIQQSHYVNRLVAGMRSDRVKVITDMRRGRAQLEVDFICNKGRKRYYVQSAPSLPTEQKWEQEQRSLLKIKDGFKKIITTRDGLAPHYNDVGILVMNVYDFLLDPRSLEF